MNTMDVRVVRDGSLVGVFTLTDREIVLMLLKGYTLEKCCDDDDPSDE